MATNVNTFYQFAKYLTLKANAGNTLTSAEFTNAANQAQFAIFATDYAEFATTGVVTNFLQTYLKAGNDALVRQVNPINPIVPWDDNLQYVCSVGHRYNGKQYDCELVDNVNWREMNAPGSLNQPTLRFVKYQQISSGLMFAPANVGTVYIDYFATLTAPVWNYSVVNGAQVYNPIGSVDFEWDGFNTNRIMSVFLSMVGINLKDVDILNWSNEFKKETGIVV